MTGYTENHCGTNARMEVQPNYAAVLRLATARPANEDGRARS